MTNNVPLGLMLLAYVVGLAALSFGIGFWNIAVGFITFGGVLMFTAVVALVITKATKGLY